MIALLISLLALGPQAVQDQRAPVPEGTIISSVDVSGFDVSRLSPGLRQDIRALVGTPLKQERVDELSARIEGERPRRVSAVRTIMQPDGQARVIFMVAERGDGGDRDNVNARYIVEHVEIAGAADDAVSEALRHDLEALVGRPLESEEADRLQERLARELPRFDVTRRIERGTEQGHIRVVYQARRKEPPNWLRYAPLRSNVVFHSDQQWGSYLDLGIGSRDLRFTPILAIANGDDLVEEYSGVGLRFETRRLGTRRLGASLEWSWFDADWRDPTIAAVGADPSLPRLYDTRSTITPLVKFALTPELTISGGVGVNELTGIAPGSGSQMANAAVGALAYHRRWKGRDGGAQQVESDFQVRAGSRALQSDDVYTRYLAQGSYEYERGRHHAIASGMAGHISGDAPLFERFTLGDTRTLVGWDKYDITPAGGGRMFYAAVEYGYSGVSVFLDLGSVWDRPADRRLRVSTGIGFHAGPAFASIGFPLNTDNLSAVFTMGLRLSETKLRW